MTNQEKEDFKVAAEKLLNSIGRNMAIKYYGYDATYKITDITFYDDGAIEMYVAPDKPIEEILDVKIEPNMVWGKYADITDLILNLQYFFKYITTSDVFINIPSEYIITDEIPVKTTHFKDNPEEFIELESVGSVVHKKTGQVFPIIKHIQVNGKMIDTYQHQSLARIDNDDWWNSLSEEDIKKILNQFSS